MEQPFNSSIDMGAAVEKQSRSRSPIARNKAVDEASDTYRQAMDKVYEASWKFDRGKNGDFLKTLDNTKLPIPLFRQIVRAGMNLKLSTKELEALLPLFDNSGDVNGCDFILLFYRLRYEHRSKQFSEHNEQRKKATLLLQHKEERKQAQLDQKQEIALVESTEADLKSVLKKIVDGAVKYDRLMPGAVQLDAFDCELLKPHELKEQLKMTFNIPVTVPELSAFIRHFNKDNDLAEHINCASFLIYFFRLGFEEKNRRLHQLWDDKRRVEEARQQKAALEKQGLEMRHLLKVDRNFTEEDKASAMQKLRVAARLYDKTTPGAMSMKSFDVKDMLPHVFKEQLKMVFNLKATPAEMGALVAMFDAEGVGAIRCEEFTKVFINMGFEEREAELRAGNERQRLDTQRRLKRVEDKRRALESKNSMKVSFIFSDDEMESAMNKLVDAAWRYDKNMPGAPCLDAFEVQSIPAHVFQDQLKKAFRMVVSPQELGAIMHYFDPSDSGILHCETFLKKFFKLGFDERQRQTAEWRKHQHDLIERNKQEEMKREILKANKLSYSNADHSYTESDFQSAFAKMTTGAMKYSKVGPGAVGLEAFEAVDMLPHVFREQLKMVFNVQVTLPELWALIDYFDKDSVGTINCKYFLMQFLRTGIEERDRIRVGWRQEIETKHKKNEEKAKKVEAAKQEKAWAEADFDFLETDFDSVMHKFIDLCYNYDPRQLGAAGLVAFECDSLTPAIFREMVKRTFGLKLGPRELGAIVSYFDVSSKHVVTCSMFLNSIVQVRLKCEDFRTKKDQSKDRAEVLRALKDSYRNRVARNISLDARPWREHAVLPKSRFAKQQSKVVKLGEPVPKTPLEKYRLRLTMGEATSRLDLSSKLVWPEQQPGSTGRAVIAAAVTSQGGEEQGEEGNADEEEREEDMFEQVAVESPIEHGAGSNDKKEDSLVDFRFSIIPKEVLRLTELTELWFDNNAISELPTAIGDLKTLVVLSLNNNRLATLHPELCSLVNLKRLYLRGNKLEALPNLMGQLLQLEEVDCSKNRFSVFPEVLTSPMLRLVQMDFSENFLRTLPAGLRSLKLLTYLIIERNPLREDLVGEVLSKMPWVKVKIGPTSLQLKGAGPFAITPAEELDFKTMLKCRAAGAVTNKLRRRKKRSGYDGYF